MIRLALAGGRPPEAPDGPYPCLVMLDGREPGMRWAIDKDVVSIGTGHACDVAFVGEGLPARCAVLERGASNWILTIEPNADVSVAGQREGTVPLHGSDEIRLGDVTLEFRTCRDDEFTDRVTATKKCRDLLRVLSRIDARSIPPGLGLAVIAVSHVGTVPGRDAFDATLRWVAEQLPNEPFPLCRHGESTFVGLLHHTAEDDVRRRLTAVADLVNTTRVPFEPEPLDVRIEFFVTAAAGEHPLDALSRAAVALLAHRQPR